MPLILKTPPDKTVGETAGVSLNSQRHILVFTRTGNAGPARGASAAQLYEFDQTGKFIRELGANDCVPVGERAVHGRSSELARAALDVASGAGAAVGVAR